FAHTTYKSYPEGWLTDQKWPMLSKWVDTMSTHRVQGINFDGITDIDDWINRLADAGHYLSCSSGTTGKPAMLNASAADMEWAKKNAISSFSWSASVEANRKFLQFGLAPVTSTARNRITAEAMRAAFGKPGTEPFAYPVPSITLGAVTSMVALRKRVADGVAKPEEIAQYEAISAERQAAVDGAVGISAKALVEARREPLFISGMWGTLYKVAEEVRAMGYSGSDFNPDNIFFSAGGLKGAVLPPNYREFVFETFNVSQDHIGQHYSMQECATAMPRCKAGRYHLPPWMMCLLLDQTGENLIPVAGKGEVEGRAAFFDISIDGRWNGVISGDKITITHERCACGSPSPSIGDNISRYADLPGGDKITCAGTVDAYVRGLT
ncbi:MAG TPA: hypothetical protein VL918_04530, partial [Sphingobium sp.]|nr:hypothetical protein [Sphingobium sp.]